MIKLTRAVVVFALFFAIFSSPTAYADSLADEAEVNFRLGAERYQAGDYRSALAYFLASNRLAPNRNVRFNIARAFQRLGLYPEAHRFCLAALEGDVPEALRKELEETLKAIELEVSVLDVKTVPEGATLYVDREDLGSVASAPSRVAVAPGEHRVIATLDGYDTTRSALIKTERGKSYEITLTLSRIVGYVDVKAPKGTEVRADTDSGEPACIAPCSLALTPGTHVLYMQKPGFRIDPRQTRVEAQKRSEVSVTPVPLTGSVIVTTDERDALVEIDGVAAGFTPSVVRNVAIGERRVRVSLRGFTPVERIVTVTQDKPAEVRGLTLTPAREVTAAARMAQTIDDAPASVSVISGYELDAFRYPTIYEALRGQRGVALSSDGVYSSVSVRGLGQPGDYGNRLLVLNDGAALNDNILWQSYVGYDGRADLGRLERIELVRGPGSVLYGTGALTGVVNLVPEAPPKTTNAEARISANDERTARASARAGLPLGNRGGMTLMVAGAHGDGEEIWLPTSPEKTRVDRFDAFNAATAEARLAYGAWTLQAFGTFREQHTPQGAYGAIIADDRNRLSDARGLVEARFEPKLNRYVTLFTRAFGNLYRYRGTNFYLEPDGREKRVEERYRGDWLGAEARVMVRPLEGLRFTFGTEAQANVVATLDGKSRVDGTSMAYLDESQPYQTYAGYGLLEWDVMKPLTLSLGARLDAWSTFGATTNPRAAAILRPGQNDTVKLMAGRAFRAPSMYELRYNDDGFTQVASDASGDELSPELVWSAEVEHTHRFEDGWSLLSSVHVQRAQDLIEQSPLDPNAQSSIVVYRNASTVVHTLGGDIEVRRELGAGWTVSSTYGYLEARYADKEPDWVSTGVPNAPNHFASVRGIAPLVQRLRLAARATFESARRIRVNSSRVTERAVVADLVLTGDVPTSGLDYAVGLYNLFDFRYALPTESTFATNTMPQAGRTLLLSLGLRR